MQTPYASKSSICLFVHIVSLAFERIKSQLYTHIVEKPVETENLAGRPSIDDGHDMHLIQASESNVSDDFTCRLF